MLSDKTTAWTSQKGANPFIVRLPLFCWVVKFQNAFHFLQPCEHGAVHSCSCLFLTVPVVGANKDICLLVATMGGGEWKPKLARFLHVYLFIIVFIILKCPKAIPWENHRGDECATHIRGWTCLREKRQISRLLLITSSDDGDEDFNQRWAYGSWQLCDGELSRPEVHSSSSAQRGQNVFDCMLDNSSQTAPFMGTRPLYIAAVGSYLVVNSCKLRKSLPKRWSLLSNVKCVRPHI